MSSKKPRERKQDGEITVYVPEHLKEALRIKADEKYISLSALARQVLIEYLNS